MRGRLLSRRTAIPCVEHRAHSVADDRVSRNWFPTQSPDVRRKRFGFQSAQVSCLMAPTWLLIDLGAMLKSYPSGPAGGACAAPACRNGAISIPKAPFVGWLCVHYKHASEYSGTGAGMLSLQSRDAGSRSAGLSRSGSQERLLVNWMNGSSADEYGVEAVGSRSAGPETPASSATAMFSGGLLALSVDACIALKIATRSSNGGASSPVWDRLRIPSFARRRKAFAILRLTLRRRCSEFDA